MGRSGGRGASRVAALQAITAALVAVHTPADVARVVLSTGLAALRADAGTVRLVSEDGTHLVRAGAVGYAQSLQAGAGPVPLVREIPLCLAVRTAEALFLATPARHEARFPGVAAVHAAHGYRSMAAVPLIVDGRIRFCQDWGHLGTGPLRLRMHSR